MVQGAKADDNVRLKQASSHCFNIERLWGTSKDETFHLIVTKGGRLEIMALQLGGNQKFVADPDEMSYQGTEQSHQQGLHTSVASTRFVNVSG